MSAFGSVHRVQTPQPQMSIWLSTKASAPRRLFRVAETCWASLTASGHSITGTPLASSHPLTLRLDFAVSFGHNLIIWDSTVWEELQSTPLCLASRDSLLDSELNGVQLWYWDEGGGRVGGGGGFRWPAEARTRVMEGWGAETHQPRLRGGNDQIRGPILYDTESPQEVSGVKW